MPASLLPAILQYQRIHEKAIELFNVFDESEAPELLRLTDALNDECERLLNSTGLGWEHCGNLGRHMSFLQLFLKRNDKAACAQDTKDILLFDLPTTLGNVVKFAADDQHVDQRLKDAVAPLVDGGHYDSAVRKVFVVLTDRLRRAFAMPADIDGEELVNQIFGKGGKLPIALDEPGKLALRNLVAGFYGVYRNRFAHNDVQPSLAQTRAVIEMANTIILDIEALARESARQA